MGPTWADDDFSTPPPAGPPPTVSFPGTPAATTAPPLPTETPPQRLELMMRQPHSAPRARAGAGALVAAAGAGVGAVLGGASGAGAGLLLAGAARNLYRAQSGFGSDDGIEGAKSLTLGLLGLAAGGYLIYRCFRKDK